MQSWRVIALLLPSLAAPVGAGCGGVTPAPPPAAREGPSPLREHMKTSVNAQFSLLTFNLFHAPPGADVQAPLEDASRLFDEATQRVAGWPDPPGESPEAQKVFYNLAGQLSRGAVRLRQAVRLRDHDEAVAAFFSIQRTCEGCHHFFRLDPIDGGVPWR